MKLTERELWLMRQAFNDGVCDENFDAWLNDGAADGVTVADVLAVNAPPETVVEEFLRRTGQYVTNDASREAAIAAAVAAEREACAAVCENGNFLHDAAPTAIFGKECARAIRARSAS